ncbi:MAG: hypothetical protein AB7O59_19975 [Pirellulales bacterium]
MAEQSVFADDFIETILDILLTSVPRIGNKLSVLADPSEGKDSKSMARQMVCHDIGNMVVLAYAGLKGVIRDARKDDYQSVMLKFNELVGELRKHRFDIPPQVADAIRAVRHERRA